MAQSIRRALNLASMIEGEEGKLSIHLDTQILADG